MEQTQELNNLTPKGERKENMKQMTICWEKVGRKRQYIAIKKPGYIYPAVYFRKSKWITEKDFNAIINYLIELGNKVIKNRKNKYDNSKLNIGRR
jgi:hypothetical protein